ncbi:hypothetical protein ACJX0J_007655, partial [Zea mays]
LHWDVTAPVVVAVAVYDLDCHFETLLVLNLGRDTSKARNEEEFQGKADILHKKFGCYNFAYRNDTKAHGEAYDYGDELNRVMDALNFEYPDYERLDEGSGGANKKRVVQDVPEKTAGTS